MRNSPLKALAVVVGVAGGLAGCANSTSTDQIAQESVAMTISDQPITRASLLGHVTIVDFWAVF